jgi:acetyl-CoA C-acetyltransferase
MQKPEIVILGAARTAQGSFQGALSGMKAPALGAVAIQGALKRAGITKEGLTGSNSEVLLGNVLQAGVGQAPARQALRGAGLSDSIPALTINKVCGSGMKALMLAADSIELGRREVVIAGGMESMSNAPYLIPQARSGIRMGNSAMVDAMIHDGLWDPYHDQHMGQCGELCARERGYTREMQDAFAMESFTRAKRAQTEGSFRSEIEPVLLANPKVKGETLEFSLDEGPSKGNLEKIPTLKPVFQKDGTVTAANASTINDGASALVVASHAWAKSQGLQPLARIVSQAHHAQAPEWFTTAPAPAMKAAMAQVGWKVSDVDLFEVNEAFAVVAMAARDDLQIPPEKLNVWGGAISLGHPIGSSGSRIVVTLIHALKALGKKRGVAGICIGGGEATAVCVELVSV